MLQVLASCASSTSWQDVVLFLWLSTLGVLFILGLIMLMRDS